ncbi:NAD-dependent epimerase/dehydratase family protein [Amycolatopsis kentuckyensis]|uniref:NAD-dependent epimerase/dehydratase family protein n=1 Tax=Amycolatopsis kentuckyensis TaxID=218823 RepID=UPI003566257D
MSETVLVTGGTGYVAGWCIAELLGRGYDVRATVRERSRGERVRRAVATVTDRADHLEFAVADLTTDDGWKAAMDGCDYVLHVASPLGADPDVEDEGQALMVPARDGTLRVLRAAADAGVRRVVMTSAANAASPTSYETDGVTDETLWTDLSAPELIPYRRSKTAAELAAWDFMDSYEGPMTLATVLPGAVFGPLLSPDTLGSVQIIGRMLTGAMPGVPRIGLEVVDVRDLADVHIRALTAPEAAGQRFLATGEFLWMRDIAVILHEAYGEKVSTQEIPDDVVRAAAETDESLRGILPGLGRRSAHSTAKAERLLGWSRRPAKASVLDCASSLVDHGVVTA